MATRLCTTCEGLDCPVTGIAVAIMRAVHEAGGGLASLIIGGGPLAVAARVLVERVPVRLIEPVPAAIRRIGLMVQSANC